MPYPMSKFRMFVIGISVLFVTIVYSTIGYILLALLAKEIQ